MEQSSADIHICAKYMRWAVALRLLPVCAGPRTSSGALVDARGAHSAHSWRPRSAALQGQSSIASGGGGGESPLLIPRS
jgi:hypothetical protein